MQKKDHIIQLLNWIQAEKPTKIVQYIYTTPDGEVTIVKKKKIKKSDILDILKARGMRTTRAWISAISSIKNHEK